jgi:hypothetical protein
MVLSFNDIGAYLGMKGSAISQLSRRFKETIEGDKELGGILCKIKQEGLLNVENLTLLLSDLLLSKPGRIVI